MVGTFLRHSVPVHVYIAHVPLTLNIAILTLPYCRVSKYIYRAPLITSESEALGFATRGY